MTRFDIRFDYDIVVAAPHVRVMAVEADIVNAPTDDALWDALRQYALSLQESGLKLEDVNKLRGIRPTRVAYKACGKEPNRYRPSAEALTRRMVKGLDLYRSLMAIDLINLLSVSTGHSIGGFDADSIQGDVLTLGVGRQGEPFEAIGRGPLNIAGLPVYRDSYAAIGTPTSDCERTKLTPQTRHLLMLVNVYDADTDMTGLEDVVRSLLGEYGCAITSLTVHRALPG